MQKPPKPPSKINDGQFQTVKRLGAGCFGEVYRGRWAQTEDLVAIKFESRDGRCAPQLEHERDVLLALGPDMQPRPQGFAECFYFGIEGTSADKKFNCLVMEILGKSLEDQVQACGQKLSVKTTVLIAEQVIQRIEYLHSKGFVHRDIKPENFMFGVGKKVHHVYIIDFGLSKVYWVKHSNSHMPPRQNLSLTGTARYASIPAHKGREQGRRDDLEAIGHMLFYFLRGSLPWSGLDAKTQEEKYRMICQKKEETQISDLNTGFPKQFDEYLEYARKLEFSERPDYSRLYGLMRQCREADWQDHQYEWFDGSSKRSSLPGNLVSLVARENQKQPDDSPPPQQKSSKGFFCLCGKSPTRD